MKNFVIPGVLVGLLFMFLIGFVTSCERIDVGNIGLKVNLLGDNRGVANIKEVSGYVLYNPFSQSVVEFPTTVQNVVWNKSTTEGKSIDESITFTSSEGISVNADVGFAYRILPAKAPQIYVKFKQVKLHNITDTYIRNQVRNSLSQEASKLPIAEIYGAGKGKFASDVTNSIRAALEDDGFIVEQFTFNGALRLPANVEQAINNSIAATQKAIEAENRVRETQALAAQAVATAHGQADSQKLIAQGKADSAVIEAEGNSKAVLIEAKAQAQANELLSKSLTGQLIQMKQAERWNGQLPWYTGSSSAPIMTMNVGK